MEQFRWGFGASDDALRRVYYLDVGAVKSSHLLAIAAAYKSFCISKISFYLSNFDLGSFYSFEKMPAESVIRDHIKKITGRDTDPNMSLLETIHSNAYLVDPKIPIRDNIDLGSNVLLYEYFTTNSTDNPSLLLPYNENVKVHKFRHNLKLQKHIYCKPKRYITTDNIPKMSVTDIINACNPDFSIPNYFIGINKNVGAPDASEKNRWEMKEVQCRIKVYITYTFCRRYSDNK